MQNVPVYLVAQIAHNVLAQQISDADINNLAKAFEERTLAKADWTGMSFESNRPCASPQKTQISQLKSCMWHSERQKLRNTQDERAPTRELT